MKGIRKLFYGFVLMALFSVGFKIEAKALEYTPTLSECAISDWGNSTSASETAFTGGIKFKSGDNTGTPLNDFPAAGITKVYQLQIKEVGGTGIGEYNYYVGLKTVNNSGNYEYYYSSIMNSAPVAADCTNQITTNQGDTPNFTINIKKSDVTGRLDTHTPTGDSDDLNVQMHVLDAGTSSGNSATKTVTMYRVKATSTESKPTYINYDGIKYKFDNGTEASCPEVYLLPGEVVKVTMTVAEDQVYPLNKKFSSWSTGTGLSLTADKNESLDTGETIYCNAKMATDGTATHSTVFAEFVPGNITLSSITKVSRPSTSTTGSLSFSGAYTFNDFYRVFVDDVEINKGSVSGTTYTFDVPNTVDVGTTHYVYIQTKDGNWFKSSAFTVENNATISLKSDGVAVTIGKSSNIRQFLTDPNAASKLAKVEISGDASSYASVKPSSAISTYTALSSVTVYGDSAMKEGKKGTIKITPNTGSGDEGKVTVYPKVSISTNSSGSSDSLNSGTSSSSKETPLKVTVPAYVYYGDTGYKVTKAQIHFEGSDGTKTRSLDAPDSVSGTSWTVSVDSMKLSSILKDVCDGSSDEVKVKVWPYKGDDPDKTEGIGASTEIKAYKISLDGSGGAKYTINSEDVGDYFYAVKGTKYTIKATPKVAGDKFKNWDNNAFPSESGGDFTASESRTFKANYDNGSSSSSSSGRSTATNGESTGSGDYDDVPKTGESKTDIWILWSVLMISILGAGFMIWKRFGLARAIAEAEEQVAVAEHEEQVKAEKKAKKDKLDMLKDLRNL